jgi:hypothetical protein
MTLTVGKTITISLYGTWTGAIRVCQDYGGIETTITTLTANGNHQFSLETGKGYHLHAAMVSSGTVGWRMEESNETVYLGDLEWEDLRFPAQAINPIGAVSDPSPDTSETAFPGTLLFSSSADNMVSGIAQMSHSWQEGTPIRPHIHWAKTTSASGGVVWHLYYRIINRHKASEAWAGPVVGSMEVSDGDTANQEAITTFGSINMTDAVTSKMLAWRLYRVPGETADNYGATARLFELDFHYQRSSLGSGSEFTK